jgi:hypothetical protein
MYGLGYGNQIKVVVWKCGIFGSLYTIVYVWFCNGILDLLLAYIGSKNLLERMGQQGGDLTITGTTVPTATFGVTK